MRILVVDDNQDACDSLAVLLRLRGHEVRVAYDGRAALQLATDFLPDLAILDIGMPGMDGCETARQLRQQPALQKTVLAAVTGWGQEDDRNRSREAGFDFHLVKPVEADALGQLIQNVGKGGV